ncbi:MAG: hypothetical protein V8Q93_08950 [Blautia faecis]
MDYFDTFVEEWYDQGEGNPPRRSERRIRNLCERNYLGIVPYVPGSVM